MKHHYEEPDPQISRVKDFIANRFHGLHPLEKAKAYREIQGYACERARDQERQNTEHGVPE